MMIDLIGICICIVIISANCRILLLHNEFRKLWYQYVMIECINNKLECKDKTILKKTKKRRTEIQNGVMFMMNDDKQMKKGANDQTRTL